MAYTTPEKRVQDAIIAYLKELESKGYPCFHWRRDASGANYKKGSPDLFIVWGPYHIEVEVKKPGGQLSPMQEKWKSRFDKAGVPCWVIDDINDFKKRLEFYL